MSKNNYDDLKERQLPDGRQQIVDQLLKNLEQGCVPWHKTWQGDFFARNAVTGREYRGLNLVALLMQPHSDPRWCTFKQLEEKKWHLKKGSKGTPLELFKHIDKRTKKEISWDKIEEEIKGMEYKEQQKFLKENIRTLIKTFYVFNAEQIEGIPELERVAPSENEIANRNARVEKILSASEAPISFDGNGRNYYMPQDDSIHLTARNAFKTVEDFYAVALHEIGHSTGHQKRLNRDLTGNFGTAKYAKEELRAELGSMFMQQDLRIPDSKERIANHSAYIECWIKNLKEKPAELFDAISDANKIAKYVCSREHIAQTGEIKLSPEQKDVAAKYGFSENAAESVIKTQRKNGAEEQEQSKAKSTRNSRQINHTK